MVPWQKEITTQKGYVATILKRLRDTEVMSKPNDFKQRERIPKQGNTIKIVSITEKNKEYKQILNETGGLKTTQKLKLPKDFPLSNF